MCKDKKDCHDCGRCKEKKNIQESLVSKLAKKLDPEAKLKRAIGEMSMKTMSKVLAKEARITKLAEALEKLTGKEVKLIKINK